MTAPPDEYVGLDELMAIGGMTYRRLDHWTRVGYLTAVTATPGSGHDRRWPRAEVDVARRIVRLVDAGLEVKAAARVARGEPRIGPGITVAIEPDEARPDECAPTPPALDRAMHPGSLACDECYALTPDQFAAFPTVCPHRLSHALLHGGSNG